MVEMKIGQIVEITQEVTITSALTDTQIVISPGDKGFIDSRGLMHIISGKGRGKITPLNNMELKGYDTDGIATLIGKRLYREFELGEFLAGYDLTQEEFIDVIEDVLTDILG